MSVSLLKKSPPAPDQRVLSDLDQLAARLDQQQLWWASGYLAGLAAGAAPAAQTPEAPGIEAPLQHAWTVFYGTETGNCRAIAEELTQAIRDTGAEAEAVDLAGFRPAQLKKQARALFVVATHGLGEPPDGTGEFFEFVFGERAPRLENLGYSVLALGDSSYEDFCATGRQLDARLEALGARRLEPRVDCDVDFETATDGWKAQVLARIRADREAADARPADAAAPHLVPVGAPSYSRKHPFPAPVLGIQRITGTGSSKDVRHVMLSLEGSGLRYEPGDALGVWPTNPPRLVNQFLALTGLDAAAPVEVHGESLTLGDALAHRLELTLLGRGFVETYASGHAIAALQALLEPDQRAALNDYLDRRQVIDVLREHPVALSAQQLVDVLKRLTPRLYSIASSLDANPDEVHVTIAVVNYTAFEEEHLGCASNYLAEPGDTVPVYIAPNPRFRLPQDQSVPVIMIGAGTGVAPFRAFLEERETAGATGSNWLFFGDRNFSSDFLYQVEWARLRDSGLLSRHDVAFSRDQSTKVYIQDRIREQADEVFAWLERGAHIYVCGDAKNMAPDVHAALLDAIGRGLRTDDAEAAEAYLRELKKANRYQRDVY